MKKTLFLTGMLAVAQLAGAQERNEINMGEAFRVSASIVALVLIMVFILALIRYFLDNRLRNKIVDRGVPESVAGSLLHKSPEENRNGNIKWFSILASTGIGLLIINYTLPLGFHSLAILCISISVGFLGYYLFIRNQHGNK